MPHRTSPVASWRLKKYRYNLVGSYSEESSENIYPYRKYWPAGKETKEKKFSGIGRIISFTRVHSAPDGFSSPYVIAIIRLDEGPTITGQVVENTENIQVNQKVKPVFRKLYIDGSSGVISYGTKFVLIE